MSPHTSGTRPNCLRFNFREKKAQTKSSSFNCFGPVNCADFARLPRRAPCWGFFGDIWSHSWWLVFHYEGEQRWKTIKWIMASPDLDLLTFRWPTLVAHLQTIRTRVADTQLVIEAHRNNWNLTVHEPSDDPSRRQTWTGCSARKNCCYLWIVATLDSATLPVLKTSCGVLATIRVGEYHLAKFDSTSTFLLQWPSM